VNLKDLFVSIDSQGIQVEDITQKYVDIYARLNSKKDVEKRFLILLQKASNVKEILDIEQALRQIREEIDSTESNLKYFQNSIQFSTISIYAYTQKIGKWRKFFSQIY